MKLAVVTHTRGSGIFREAAFESVQEWLPSYAEHVVITVTSPTEMVEARVNALRLADYVAFVDDDDLVVNNSIALCYEALMANPTAGLSFCEERMMNANGSLMPYFRRPSISYQDFLNNPTGGAHHLSMIRTSCVDFEFLNANLDPDFLGSEWLIWASIALTHGAVRVPQVGYHWRQHPDAFHLQPLTQANYARIARNYRKALGSLPLAGKDLVVPEYT